MSILPLRFALFVWVGLFIVFAGTLWTWYLDRAIQGVGVQNRKGAVFYIRIYHTVNKGRGPTGKARGIEREEVIHGVRT